MLLKPHPSLLPYTTLFRSFDIDEALLQNFLALGDTIQFKVQTLLAVDNASGFKINHLSTFFRISQQSLEFAGLDLQTRSEEHTSELQSPWNQVCRLLLAKK